MTNGRIILLNGPSSAGKTSIARALQDLASEPLLYVSLDQYLSMLPARYFGNDTPADDVSAEGFRWVTNLEAVGPYVAIQPGAFGNRLILEVMHPAIRSMAAAGHDLVVDDVLLEGAWLLDYLDTLAGFETWFVKVDCPRDVLEARERARGDRTIGQARAQQVRIHHGATYDLELDSSRLTPAESAARILAARLNPPAAFAEMRRAKAGG